MDSRSVRRGMTLSELRHSNGAAVMQVQTSGARLAEILGCWVTICPRPSVDRHECKKDLQDSSPRTALGALCLDCQLLHDRFR